MFFALQQLEFSLKSLGEEKLGISSRIHLFFFNIVAKGQVCDI